MLRQSIIKAARPASLISRSFTTTIRAMGEGDTGALRSGGGQGDAFTKREKANENYAVRQREKEKFAELSRRIAEQKEHLQKLEDHLEDVKEEQSGGEQN